MNDSSRPIFKQLLPSLALGGIVLFGLLILGNFNLIVQKLLVFKWVNFLYAIALSFLSLACRFLKRAINLHRSGVQKVTFVESLRIFIASLPLTITPSNIGESYKGIWLYRLSGIPVERAVSVFYVDQISDSLSLFLLLVIGTIAFPLLWPLFLLLLLIFFGATVYLRLKPESSTLSGFREKILLLTRSYPQLREYVDTNPALFTLGNMFLTFLIGVISCLAEGGALFTILVGLNLHPSIQLAAIAIFVFAFSHIIGLATRLPGGLGVIEIALASLLTLLIHSQPEIAVAATMLFRFASFWLYFLLGLLIWTISGKALGINPQEGHIIES